MFFCVPENITSWKYLDKLQQKMWSARILMFLLRSLQAKMQTISRGTSIRDVRRSLEKIRRRGSRRRGRVNALAACVLFGACSRAQSYRPHLELARGCRHPFVWSFQEPRRRPREQDKQPFLFAEPMRRDKTGKGPSLCSSLKSQREGLVLQPRAPKEPPPVSDSASRDSEETLQVWTRCTG